MNYHKLHNFCNSGITKLRTLGDYVPCIGNSGYTYLDRGANVLGVAHLDTVQNSRQFARKHGKVYSPRLDDRLGVYTLLYTLADLGFDVLLTENEEDMNSTAQYFKPTKTYNWLFQFDRSGTDAVLYQYETPENIARLQSVGYTVGIGSYSDICELDHLGVSGFNFGTSYYRPHSLTAYMIESQYRTSVTKFRSFFAKYHAESIPHDYSYTAYYGPKWDTVYDHDPYLPRCPLCDLKISRDDIESMWIHGICSYCYRWIESYSRKS